MRENSQIIRMIVLGNLTFNNLKNDRRRWTLGVLTQQPEVNPSKITLIGHREARSLPRIWQFTASE